MDFERDFYQSIKETFALDDMKPSEVAPLILAHIGDAVYEVVVRTIELSKGNRAIEKVHRDSIKFVNAAAQSKMVDAIMPLLTEDELKEYKRGRNAKSYTHAKNASISDYRKATGFESLMGYLYLSGKSERMLELIKEGMKNA